MAISQLLPKAQSILTYTQSALCKASAHLPIQKIVNASAPCLSVAATYYTYHYPHLINNQLCAHSPLKRKIIWAATVALATFPMLHSSLKICQIAAPIFFFINLYFISFPKKLSNEEEFERIINSLKQKPSADFFKDDTIKNLPFDKQVRLLQTIQDPAEFCKACAAVQSDNQQLQDSSFVPLSKTQRLLARAIFKGEVPSKTIPLDSKSLAEAWAYILHSTQSDNLLVDLPLLISNSDNDEMKYEVVSFLCKADYQNIQKKKDLYKCIYLIACSIKSKEPVNWKDKAAAKAIQFYWGDKDLMTFDKDTINNHLKQIDDLKIRATCFSKILDAILKQENYLTAESSANVLKWVEDTCQDLLNKLSHEISLECINLCHLPGKALIKHIELLCAQSADIKNPLMVLKRFGMSKENLYRQVLLKANSLIAQEPKRRSHKIRQQLFLANIKMAKQFEQACLTICRSQLKNNHNNLDPLLKQIKTVQASWEEELKNSKPPFIDSTIRHLSYTIQGTLIEELCTNKDSLQYANDLSKEMAKHIKNTLKSSDHDLIFDCIFENLDPLRTAYSDIVSADIKYFSFNAEEISRLFCKTAKNFLDTIDKSYWPKSTSKEENTSSTMARYDRGKQTLWCLVMMPMHVCEDISENIKSQEDALAYIKLSAKACFYLQKKFIETYPQLSKCQMSLFNSITYSLKCQYSKILKQSPDENTLLTLIQIIERDALDLFNFIPEKAWPTDLSPQKKNQSSSWLSSVSSCLPRDPLYHHKNTFKTLAMLPMTAWGEAIKQQDINQPDAGALIDKSAKACFNLQKTLIKKHPQLLTWTMSSLQNLLQTQRSFFQTIKWSDTSSLNILSENIIDKKMICNLIQAPSKERSTLLLKTQALHFDIACAQARTTENQDQEKFISNMTQYSIDNKLLDSDENRSQAIVDRVAAQRDAYNDLMKQATTYEEAKKWHEKAIENAQSIQTYRGDSNRLQPDDSLFESWIDCVLNKYRTKENLEKLETSTLQIKNQKLKNQCRDKILRKRDKMLCTTSIKTFKLAKDETEEQNCERSTLCHLQTVQGNQRFFSDLINYKLSILSNISSSDTYIQTVRKIDRWIDQIDVSKQSTMRYDLISKINNKWGKDLKNEIANKLPEPSLRTKAFFNNYAACNRQDLI